MKSTKGLTYTYDQSTGIIRGCADGIWDRAGSLYDKIHLGLSEYFYDMLEMFLRKGNK